MRGEGATGWGERERVTGDHPFVISSTRPLLSCSDVSDCHRPFSTT